MGRPALFVQVPYDLLDDPDLDAIAVAVYIALRRLVGFGTNAVAASDKEISTLAKCSERAARERREKLKNKGWVSWVYEFGKPNSYKVCARRTTAGDAAPMPRQPRQDVPRSESDTTAPHAEDDARTTAPHAARHHMPRLEADHGTTCRGTTAPHAGTDRDVTDERSSTTPPSSTLLSRTRVEGAGVGGGVGDDWTTLKLTNDPDEPTVREAISELWTAFLDRLSQEGWRADELRRLRPQARSIMNGNDNRVWRDTTGAVLSPSECLECRLSIEHDVHIPGWLKLFNLAICRLEAEPATGLRSHLIYVTKQQLSERKSKPEPLEKREHIGPRIPMGGIPSQAPISESDEQAFNEWCASHPADVETLRNEIGTEIVNDPVYRDMTDSPIKTGAMRSRAKRQLRERVLEIISRETAGVS